MSRIGNLPIEIPSGVEVKVDSDNLVEVKGNLGTLTQKIDDSIDVKVEDGQIVLERPSDSKRDKSIHGLSRSLVYNMIEGVTEGYKKELEIIGTGYRAAKNGNTLSLTLGFSHPLDLEDPEGIEVEVPNANTIIVKGADKQAVGQYAAKIRSFREPEPYKGKGVRYKDEYVLRKVGKTGK